MHLTDARWRSASQCNAEHCVEVALTGGQIAVRDSKNPDGPVLLYTPSEWQAFLEGARNGEFDAQRLSE
ncbi:DUF397 domain-containing protein [Sphaerisporangium dianthi]|uniref:DUF397 domain-containing protein n=1 Tax=Sphaerisporangium dianthi TaxID=1436120 RepID=A0ABV9CRN5_9ACTN